MNILAFVDIHGNKAIIQRLVEKAKNADILVCAGDISNWGKNLKELFSLLSKANKHLLIIPGNHETNEGLKEACSQFDFATYLHQGSYQLNEYLFFGYGGGGFSVRDERLERIFEKFKKTVKKDSKVIFVTHAPPHNTELDKLPYNMHHCGCKSVRKFIDEVQPVLNICGHLHENIKKKDRINNTLIINPGADGIIITL